MLKKLSTWEGATWVTVFAALALTANSVYTGAKRSQRAPTEPWADVAGWQSYATSGHRIDSGTAPVTIVVFSDYQCAACVKMDQQLRALRKTHGPSVSVVIRHFPLPFHVYARGAAVAAECAAKQYRFTEYHERLMNQHDKLGEQPWALAAAAAGVSDTAAFNRCLGDPRVAALIDADIAAGTRLGVFGTPTVLINNEQYVGIPWDFKEIVARHVAMRTADPSR